MPFALNEATEYINPTKTLEYMAAGKPIVSTADLRRRAQLHAGRGRRATRRRSSSPRCAPRSSAPSAEMIARGLEQARANSWESIVARMERIIRDADAHARVARRAHGRRPRARRPRPAAARVPRSRARARTSATERARIAARSGREHDGRSACARRWSCGRASSARSTAWATCSTISSSSPATTADSTISTGSPRSASARSAIPILWERIERLTRVERAVRLARTRRLARLRALGIEPIVGLVHHGSGPFGTSLLDDGFAERLAELRARGRRAVSVGRRATRRSTSRSPRRGSARCTAPGIRTRATTRRSCARR